MRIAEQTPETRSRGKAITIVGCGVIGSYAAPLVARLPGVASLRLIDGDIYSKSNLRSQAITPADVGHPKVEVLARRIRRQSPDITVDPIFRWLEHVPRSLLRADVVLTCLDSRRARCIVNEACWRLGIPLIDSGVDGAGLLARTNVYKPGPGPCLECAWGEADYAALEQVYACQQGSGGPSATNAPASLGSIAAGLLVGECQQLLAGDLKPGANCRQVLWDCGNHRCLVTEYRVNPGCRFDHEIWDIELQPVSVRSVTLGQFLELVGGSAATSSVAIQLAGQHFVTRLVCGVCGTTRDKCLYLDRALTPARMRCRACGQQMSVSGFHAAEWLDSSALSNRQARRSMSSVGFRPGDIVTVRQADGRRHIELVDLLARVPELDAASDRSEHPEACHVPASGGDKK